MEKRQQLESNIEIEGDDDVSFGDLLFKFLPYWPVFVILILLSLLTTWLYLRYKIPVYETTATILIKDDKKGGSVNDPLEIFDLFGSQKNLENEIEVLQSKTLMREVVKNLHLYAPLIIEGRVSSKSAYASSPVILEVKEPDSLRSVQKTILNYDNSSRTITALGSSYPLSQWIITKYGTIRFLPNKYFHDEKQFEKGDEMYFSLRSVQATTNSILNEIKINPSGKQSTVIELSIQGEVPQRGEDVLNELLGVYNEAAIKDKNVLAANTLKFVEDRLKYVVNELDSVEQSLQIYKAQNKIVDISEQGQIFLQSVASNDQKIGDINIELAVLDQVENHVKSKLGSGNIVPSTLGLEDPVLSDLLVKLSELELQYSQTKKIVPESNPAMVAIRDGIEKIRPNILENIQSKRKNLAAARQDLESTSKQFNAILKSIPEKERELLSISRQQGIKNNIYTFLLQKREEAALSFASAVADNRIIDTPETSSSPVGPKKSLIYLISIFSAVVVGVLGLIIKEWLTRSCAFFCLCRR